MRSRAGKMSALRYSLKVQLPAIKALMITTSPLSSDEPFTRSITNNNPRSDSFQTSVKSAWMWLLELATNRIRICRNSSNLMLPCAKATRSPSTCSKQQIPAQPMVANVYACLTVKSPLTPMVLLPPSWESRRKALSVLLRRLATAVTLMVSRRLASRMRPLRASKMPDQFNVTPALISASRDPAKKLPILNMTLCWTPNLQPSETS